MALTITPTTPGRVPRSGGAEKVLWGTMDFDSSYGPGGESLVAGDLGFTLLDRILFEDKSGYQFDHDRTNNKIRVFLQTQSGTVTVNPANHTAVASVNTDVTVTGLVTTDVVMVVPPITLEAGIVVQGAAVSSTDTLRIRTTNASAGAIDPASATWTWVVLGRKEVLSGTDLSGLTAVRFLAVGI